MASVYSRNAPGDRKFSQPSAIIFLLLTRSEREFIRPDEIFGNEAERGFWELAEPLQECSASS